MKFGMIIPFYNNFKFTDNCVKSIRKHSQDYQIVFIDNGSGLETKEKMKGLLQPNSILMTNEKNLGFAKAVNQGLQKVNAEFICILNNDVEFQGDCLTQAENYFNQYRGFIGSMGYNISSSGQQTYDSKLGDGVDYLGMFFLFSSRKNFDLVGPLSEDYGLAYWEDVDYGMRILQKRLKSYVVPISVLHFACSTSRLLDSQVLLERCGGRNKDLFLNKWKTFLEEREVK